MNHFWINKEHYNILSTEESARYEVVLKKYINKFRVIGIVGWDNFILSDGSNHFSIPTVPVDQKYLKELEYPDLKPMTKSEQSEHSKIKWYLTPLIFGGSPDSESNIAWVTIDEHIKLITFWNQKYFEIKNNR